MSLNLLLLLRIGVFQSYISPRATNIYPHLIIAAITATIKKYPVTVFIPKGKGCLKEESMINMAQIITIDKGRLLRKLGRSEEEKIMEVNEAIRVSLEVN